MKSQQTDGPPPEPDRQKRAPVVMGLVLLLASALLLLTYWRGSRSGSGPPAPGDAPPDSASATRNGAERALPPLRSTSYLNTDLAVQYVGTQRCVECHVDEHAGYLGTGHSRSLNVVEPGQEPPDGQFAHAASGLHYEAHRRDGQLWHRESLLVPGGEPRELADRPLAYRVGSGRFARTYIAEIDGFLVESPLTWYAAEQAWQMSPGYDNPAHLSFQRNINAGCVFCHAGRADREAQSVSRMEFQELVIGCERCHGPGSLHVARHTTGGGSLEGKDLTIVNPRELPRALSEAVCHQCHLESVGSTVFQGRSRRDFRPGLHWNDFCVNYDLQASSEAMTVTGHVQQMHKSRCYQESETLTCITCHNLHAPPAADERANVYRAACYTCHADESCKLPQHERQQQQANDCTACHMPSSATEVPHVAFTHHRIGIHGAEPEQPHNELAVAPFVPVLDVSHLPEWHRQRNLALAYLKRYIDSGADPRLVWYRNEAERLLNEVREQGADDDSILAGLAAIAGDRGDMEATQRYAEQVLASEQADPDDRVTVLNLLANVYVRQQRLQASQQMLEELLRLRLDPRDAILLGLCREQQGNVPGAIAALERVARIDPKMPETYEVLSQLHARRGDAEAERRHAEQARLLRALRPQ